MLTVCSNAQTPILSINDNSYPEIAGAYYKDTNNHLDQFIGTWMYSNGTTSLTITLQKKPLQHTISGNYDFYEDIIVGEYKYIENGIVKINTLSEILFSKDAYKYNITGNIFLDLGNTKLLTTFSDPQRNILGMEATMRFQRADAGNIQKIDLLFKMSSSPTVVDGVEPQFNSYTIPFGEYLLVKQ